MDEETVRKKAYFIWLFKQRNGIKNIPEENWHEAEYELMTLERLTSGNFTDKAR